MARWERTAQDNAEAEHPPPETPQGEPKFRPAWGPASIVIAVGVAMVAVAIAFGLSYF